MTRYSRGQLELVVEAWPNTIHFIVYEFFAFKKIDSSPE